VKYAFMRTHHPAFRIRRMCQALGVSPSGYYAWRDRPPSPQAKANRALLAEIRRVHAAARGVYGARKTWQQLRVEGIPCGKHRVARLRGGWPGLRPSTAGGSRSPRNPGAAKRKDGVRH